MASLERARLPSLRDKHLAQEEAVVAAEEAAEKLEKVDEKAEEKKLKTKK